MIRKQPKPPLVQISDEDAYFVKKIHARCYEEGNCLIWPGAMNKGVLPQAHYNGATSYLRKVLWEIHYGPVKPGHGVTNDCPSTRCIGLDCLVSLDKKASLSLAAKKGQRNQPARIAKMVATKRAKSVYDESDIQTILNAETLDEAVALTGISKSYASTIRRGQARQQASNPFAALYKSHEARV